MNDVIEATLPRRKQGKRKTLIAFVLDQSSSMSCGIKDTMEAFNNFISEQKKIKDGALFLLTRFNTKMSHKGFMEPSIEMMEAPEPLTSAPELSFPDSYYPQGNTPLLDAIGATITSVEKFNKDDEYSVILVIVTDGMENSSKEYRVKAIKHKIMDLQANKNWTFVFLGADLEQMTADSIARDIGIPQRNTVAYGKMHETRATMKSMSENMTVYRTTASNPGEASVGDFWKLKDKEDSNG